MEREPEASLKLQPSEPSGSAGNSEAGRSAGTSAEQSDVESDKTAEEGETAGKDDDDDNWLCLNFF